MRHNSLIVTWVALFLLQAPLAAKPQERKPPAQAPAPAPTPDPRVQEIDKIWMQSLHGQETQPEGNPAQPQSEPGPEDSGTRLLNPGPDEQPAPVQTPAPESRLFRMKNGPLSWAR